MLTPLNPLYVVKLGFTGVYIILLFVYVFEQK